MTDKGHWLGLVLELSNVLLNCYWTIEPAFKYCKTDQQFW